MNARKLTLALAMWGLIGLPAHAQSVMQTYYGTTHAHTGEENDHGADASKAADVFQTARDQGFDFIFLTEHSGPSGPSDPLRYYNEAKAASRTYSQDDVFAAFAGYEFSNNDDGPLYNGHMTGFGTDDFVDASLPGMGFDEFLQIIASDTTPWLGMAGFNHPPAVGHNGSRAELLTPERRDAVVMTETINSVPYKPATENAYFRAMVAELDRGWRVAPTCGLDTHGLWTLKLQETADKKPCRTGVLAPRLTRWQILNGMENRRMFATRDMNLDVRYKVNGKWMGSEIGTPDTLQFEINVNDPDVANANDRISRIEIIGNGGQVVAAQSFNTHVVSWSPVVTRGSHTYMFIRVFNGEQPYGDGNQGQTAIAAPVWFNAPRPLRPGYYYYN